VSEGKLTATIIMPPPAGRAVSELATMLRGGHARPAAEISIAPSSFPPISSLR
jgi:hypothetical protein